MLNDVASKKSKLITNEEGYKVYKRKSDLDLFLNACGFLPRNSFYHDKKDKLDYIISLIQKVDKEFVFALAWFLGKIVGLRLIPTILITELALNAVDGDWNKIRKIIKDVFIRPDFIANSCAYIKYKYNTKSFMTQMPDNLKKILREQLESFDDVTLKKRKMKRRSIKLADLIKTLKPKPRNEYYSKLYKAIIENDKFASLKIEVDEDGIVHNTEHIVSVLSSDKISTDNKKKYFNDNIDNIPINSLLNNLAFVDDISKLENRLNNIFSSNDSLRFVNPFNLILLKSSRHKYSSNAISDDIIKVLDKILFRFVIPNFNNTSKAVILYDTSGSMKGVSHEVGSKFISIFYNLFNKDFKLYCFNYNVKEKTDVLLKIKNESNNSINKFVNLFYQTINKTIYGRTALLDSIKEVIETNKDIDLFVIITDEVSWADEKYVTAYKKIIPENLYDKVILFNVSPSAGTVFKPSSEITRVSGLNTNSIMLIDALYNFESFKNRIITEFKEKCNE